MNDFILVILGMRTGAVSYSAMPIASNGSQEVAFRFCNRVVQWLVEFRIE